MVNVIVAGAAGRMGCRLVALTKDSLILTLAGAIEGKGHPAIGADSGETAGCGRIGLPITDDLDSLLDRGEVVVDFSTPEATLHHLHTVARHKLQLIATQLDPDAFESLFSRVMSLVPPKELEAILGASPPGPLDDHASREIGNL